MLDIELATVRSRDEDTLAVEWYDTMWCLSRIHGVPREVSFWDITEDAKISLRELRDQLHTGSAASDQPSPALPLPQRADLDMTVVTAPAIGQTDRARGTAKPAASDQPRFSLSLQSSAAAFLSAATVVDELCTPPWSTR